MMANGSSKPFPIRTSIAVGGIILAAILGYILITLNEFTYDDHYSLSDNPALHQLSNIKYIFTQKYFTVSHEASYRPVITLLNFLEYALFGHNPAGYHLVNVLLHALCAVLLYLFVKSFVGHSIAFITGLFHAVHPIFSESVAAITFGEDLLCLLFLLIALYCAKKWLVIALPLKKYLYFGIILFSYACALGSKEMAVFFPIGFLLFLPYLGTNCKRGLKLFVALSLILFGFLFLRFLFLANPDQAELNRINEPAKWFSVIYYLPDYLGLYLFPIRLSIIHYVKTIPPENIFLTISCWILFFGFLTVGLCGIRKKSLYGIGIIWFLLSLTPVAGIIPLKFPFAERYMYIPGIGLHLVAAGLLVKGYKHMENLKRKRLYCVGILTLMLVLTIRCVDRVSDWKTETSLWKATARTAFYSPAVHYSLGKLYQDSNQPNKAEKEYKRAIYLNQDYLAPYINLAVIYMDRKEYLRALTVNNQILKRNPRIAIVYINNAAIYRELNKPEEERISYLRALSCDPEFSPAYYALSDWYVKRNMINEAVAIWRKGITHDPAWIDAYVNLYKYYMDKDNTEEAISIIKRGIAFNPQNQKLRTLYLRIKALN